MAKKNFVEGLNVLLTPKEEATKKNKPVAKESVSSDNATEVTRATFMLPGELLSEVKAIAYWERCRIKDVVSEALAAYCVAYEKKKGKIRAIPTKNKLSGITELK